jgi:hypothetical protein
VHTPGGARSVTVYGTRDRAEALLTLADAVTTLREYADALPLTDRSVADALDRRGTGGWVVCL